MTQETILKYGVKIIIIFMVIPIHEFAHAWAASRMGDDTPAYQKRLTLSPFAHIDPIGALSIFFTGYGWGRPVQVNPLNFKKYRKGMALTAAAGPFSNIIVAVFGIIAYKLSNGLYQNNVTDAMYWLTLIFQYFTYINIGLAIFNLIPLPPLDGSKIVSYFSSAKYDKFMAENQLIIYIVFLGLLFSGLLNGPLSFVQDKIFWVLDKLTFWMDIIVNAIVR